MNKSFFLIFSYLIILTTSNKFPKHIGHLSLSNTRERRKNNERKSSDMINMVDRLQKEIKEKVDDAITKIFDDIEESVTNAKNTIQDTNKVVSDKVEDEITDKSSFSIDLMNNLTDTLEDLSVADADREDYLEAVEEAKENAKKLEKENKKNKKKENKESNKKKKK